MEKCIAVKGTQSKGEKNLHFKRKTWIIASNMCSFPTIKALENKVKVQCTLLPVFKTLLCKSFLSSSSCVSSIAEDECGVWADPLIKLTFSGARLVALLPCKHPLQYGPKILSLPTQLEILLRFTRPPFSTRYLNLLHRFTVVVNVYFYLERESVFYSEMLLPYDVCVEFRSFHFYCNL